LPRKFKMTQKQWLEYKVVELSYRGNNYRQIAEALQISITTISRVLHQLNVDARDEIKLWIDMKTPFEYTKSLMMLEYLHRKAIEIIESTKDERVALEAINRLVDLDSSKRQLLSDSVVIDSAIKHLQKQRKQEILENTKAAEALEKQLLDAEVERRLAAALKKHSSSNQKQESEQSQNNEQAKE
jgi:phosphotransferase system HPr-like phosphotransfer protein